MSDKSSSSTSLSCRITQEVAGIIEAEHARLQRERAGAILPRSEAVLAIDNCEAAVNSFNLNVKGEIAVIRDLSTLTAAEITELMKVRAPGVHPVGVIGGPPCQGFSYGNVYANPGDPRNLLPFKYAE